MAINSWYLKRKKWREVLRNWDKPSFLHDEFKSEREPTTIGSIRNINTLVEKKFVMCILGMVVVVLWSPFVRPPKGGTEPVLNWQERESQGKKVMKASGRGEKRKYIPGTRPYHEFFHLVWWLHPCDKSYRTLEALLWYVHTVCSSWAALFSYFSCACMVLLCCGMHPNRKTHFLEPMSKLVWD